jgi:CBS domain-containing protein
MFPTVRQYMDTETHALSESDDIYDAVRTLIDQGVTGAPVIDQEGKLSGMLSELECLRLLSAGDRDQADAPAGTVDAYMLRDFKTVTPEMDVYYVAGMFLSDPSTRRLAVVEGPRLVGVITRKDILRAVVRGVT